MSVSRNEGWKSTLFMTYAKYLEQNPNSNFRNYLVAYFDADAKNRIIRAIEGEGMGNLSRLTNNLPTMHPIVSNRDIIESFKNTVHLLEESKDKETTLKRWYYASMDILSKLYLDPQGKIKDELLQTVVGDKYKTLDDVKSALYGNPEDPKKVHAVADQVIASVGLGIQMVLATDKEISDITTKYHEHSMGMSEDPENNVRVADLLPNFGYEDLKNFKLSDYYLCRIEWLNQQKLFLRGANELATDKINNLDEVVNALYGKVVGASPLVNQEEYDQHFATAFKTFDKFASELMKKNPELADGIDQYRKLRDNTFRELPPADSKDRPKILENFGERIKTLQEDMKETYQQSNRFRL